MPILGNPRHELFAQAVASGKSASEAYRQSGANGKNGDVQAAKLVVKGSIRERVAELKAAQSQKSELSRDQARRFDQQGLVAYRVVMERMAAGDVRPRSGDVGIAPIGSKECQLIGLAAV